MDTKPNNDYPCKKYTCAIQACLVKNNYDQSKCQIQLDNLKTCCLNLWKKQEKSPACTYIIEKFLQENHP